MKFATIIATLLFAPVSLLAANKVGNVVTKFKSNPLTISAANLNAPTAPPVLQQRLSQSGQLIRFVSMQSSGLPGQVNVNQYREDWVSRSQGGGTERMTIGIRERVYDPSVGSSMTIDMTTRAGRKFRSGVETIVGSVVPEVINFQDRQAMASAQREQFQQHFQQSVQKKEQYVDELRRQSQVYEDRQREQSNLGMSQLGAGLAAALDENSALTLAERHAREEAANLSNSPLRTAEYEYNAEALRLMEDDLKIAAAEKRYQDMSELAEALTYGKVDGQLKKSKVLENYARADGVLKVGGTFDQAKFKTPVQSASGQAVRRMANRYQSLWAQSSGLSVLSSAERARYTLGALAIGLADSELSLADSDDEDGIHRGAGFLSLAQTMADSIAGFGSGVAESFESLAKAIPELAVLSAHGVHKLFSDPEAAWEVTLDFATKLPEIGGQIMTALIKDYNQLKHGSAYERGEILGRYALDIISLAASAGAGAALKGTALGTKVGQLGSVLAKTIPASVRTRAGMALASSIEIINKMPPPARLALEKAALKNLDSVPVFSKVYVKAARRGQTLTVQYLERVAAAGINISEAKNISKVAKLHASALKTLDDIPGISRTTIVSRGIAKDVVENGVTKRLTPDDVFNNHWSQLTSDHRYTIGGPMGSSGLYMTEGTIAETAGTLVKETGRTTSELVMAEKKISYNKLLDLTNDENLKKLGLNRTMIDLEKDYSWTQMIGDAAKQKGFDGIIFKSTKGPFDNIVIFN